MTKDQLGGFKDLLQKEKVRIENSLRMAISDLQDNAEQPASDQIDEAVALNQAAMSLRFKERDRNLLAKVNLALMRIEEGTFGECVECGEPIGVKRLKIRPVTTHCILCKEIQEKQEAHFASV